MRRAAFHLAVAALAVSAGCDSWGDMACHTAVYPAVVVEIRDAVTGAPIAEEARGVARTAAWEDSLRPHMGSADALISRAAWGPPGLYEVVVARTGYRTWSRQSVLVTENECSVATTDLRADLEPIPPSPEGGF